MTQTQFEASELSAILEELARAPAAEMDVPVGPGTTLGRFEVLRELGRGGFGVVYEARDRELGRVVAVKALRPGTTASGRLREVALRREAEAAAQLNHPNICTLHEAGRAGGAPYLVLELCEGQSLAARLERGPLPWRTALQIGIEIARALDHAHGSGVLHRDLKPANVMLAEEGGVKVLDFGLALVFGGSSLGKSGTPAYMAPEQWRGDAEDARTDLFALGVVLFEMLAWRLPYDVRSGRSEALDATRPARLDVPGVPRALASAVERAIAPDPAARPRNARVLLDQLIALQRTLQRRASLIRRARSAAIAAAALVCAAAAAW
ncbi:MAG TPA: serine/threonine-protein kinase, partial [Anaeromyxobacter sp.]